MLDSFKSESARDFRQRYSGSYGYYTVPETGRRVLVFIAEIKDESMTFMDEHSTQYTARVDGGVEFEFIPVSKRLFIMNDKLHMVQRRPARQWSRGMNQTNTSVHAVAPQHAKTLSFKAIKAAFHEENIPVSLKDVESKKTDAALLSRIFGVQAGQIFVYEHPIGVFAPDRKEIVLDEPIFKQEVVDLVVKHKLEYKVSHG